MAELADAFLVLGVRVKNRRVPQAAVFQQRLGVGDGVLVGGGLVHRQRRRQLLAGERHVRPDALDLRDQDLRAFRNLDACHFGDGDGCLADDFRVDFTVHLNDLAD